MVIEYWGEKDAAFTIKHKESNRTDYEFNIEQDGNLLSRFSIKFMYIKILKSTVVDSVCYVETGTLI